MKNILCPLIIVFLIFSTNVFSQPLRLPKEVLNLQLLEASSDGNLEEVKRLLLMGADINTKNEYGSTPFKLALIHNNCSVVEYLLQRGQDPNADPTGGGVTPLMGAAANGDIELLKLLLRYGADPDYPVPYGNTALMSATRHTEIFKILVDHHANINAINEDGRSVLIWAAYNGTEEVITLLCRLGADLEAKDKYGNTALMIAKKKGRLAVVKLLENCAKTRSQKKD
jgi:ankyrin repeat protein